MTARPVAFRPPAGQRIELPLRPRLASWERKTSTEQLRLREYLDTVAALVEPSFAAASEQALQVDIGLGSRTDLLVQRDLDNYLQPLADRLPARICSFWAIKSTAETSAITIGPAIPAAQEDLAAWHHARARGQDSAQRPQWKRSITSQLARQASLAPDGAVELQLALAVGTGRNWRGVWKAAIDSLDPILGRTDPGREFHPRDDRIVRLALHRTIDPGLEWEVELAVWWRMSPAHPEGPQHAPASPAAAPLAPQRSVPAPDAAAVREPFQGHELIKLNTLDDFRRAVAGGSGVIAIRDPAITKVHTAGCTRGLQEQHFLTKTARAKASTGYYWAPSVAAVRARWSGARGCQVCGT